MKGVYEGDRGKSGFRNDLKDISRTGLLKGKLGTGGKNSV
jgi:hypothetical protein